MLLQRVAASIIINPFIRFYLFSSQIKCVLRIHISIEATDFDKLYMYNAMTKQGGMFLILYL